MVAQPRGGGALAGAGQPGVGDDLGELVTVDLAQPAGPQQHRGVAVEVRRGEVRRRLVEHEGELLLLGADPEHDHVVVPLTGLRVERVGPWVAEEHEAPPGHLVDRVLLRATDPGHPRHRRRQLVDVGHRRRPAHGDPVCSLPATVVCARTRHSAFRAHDPWHRFASPADGRVPELPDVESARPTIESTAPGAARS